MSSALLLLLLSSFYSGARWLRRALLWDVKSADPNEACVMRSYSSLAAHAERRDGRAFDRRMFISELDVADPRTAAAVRDVGRRAYAVEAELIGFAGIPALAETVEEMQAQPLNWLGMVTSQGRIAAFIAWRPLEREDGVDIDRLCVDPEFFRRGVARTLLGHLVNGLSPGGTALVSTGADNRPAISLYERLGFARVGTVRRAPGLLMAEFRLVRGRSRSRT